MNIITKSTNFPLMLALNAHIEKTFGHLDKIIQNFGDDIKANVEVGRSSFHHKKGEVFFAEVNLHLGKNTLRSRAEAGDVYSAIDMVRDELRDEILKFKGKKNTLFKRGARSIGKLFRLSPLARFRKKFW